MITLIKVELHCNTCNKLTELNPIGICKQCETKYYFDTVFELFKQNCILYTYTNGNETKMVDGFIRLICPTKSAILNNIT